MTMPQTTPALARLTDSAARIIRHLGGETTFRKLAATKDKRRGSEQWAVTVPSVTAGARRFFETRKKEGGERQRVERLAIERAPFDAHGGLTDEWEAALAEGWTPIENVVLSEDETQWEADLCPVKVAP